MCYTVQDKKFVYISLKVFEEEDKKKMYFHFALP